MWSEASEAHLLTSSQPNNSQSSRPSSFSTYFITSTSCYNGPRINEGEINGENDDQVTFGYVPVETEQGTLVPIVLF